MALHKIQFVDLYKCFFAEDTCRRRLLTRLGGTRVLSFLLMIHTKYKNCCTRTQVVSFFCTNNINAMLGLSQMAFLTSTLNYLTILLVVR